MNFTILDITIYEFFFDIIVIVIFILILIAILIVIIIIINIIIITTTISIIISHLIAVFYFDYFLFSMIDYFFPHQSYFYLI